MLEALVSRPFKAAKTCRGKSFLRHKMCFLLYVTSQRTLEMKRMNSKGGVSRHSGLENFCFKVQKALRFWKQSPTTFSADSFGSWDNRLCMDPKISQFHDQHLLFWFPLRKTYKFYIFVHKSELSLCRLSPNQHGFRQLILCFSPYSSFNVCQFILLSYLSIYVDISFLLHRWIVFSSRRCSLAMQSYSGPRETYAFFITNFI